MAGIYIHIPFCHSKCAYCDFFSRPNDNRHEELCRAIAKEWTLRHTEITSPPTTIYIGGGTPSIVDPRFLAHIVNSIDLSHVMEFTIEVNPEDVTSERVKIWTSLGVNRISMGVQSFVDDELRAVGRRHSATKAIEAYNTLRQCGINNISLDLIYGLPQQTNDSWLSSLNRLFELKPEHFSAYALSIEPGTRIYAQVKSGKFTPTDDYTIIAMYDSLIQKAKDNGYEHYEISNFGLPGCHSKHNSSYWDSTPYIGLGPAAHSFDGLVRRYNPNNITTYLSSIDENKVAYAIDDENDTDRINDIIFTRLRTAKGLDIDELPDSCQNQVLTAATHINPELLSINKRHLSIPEKSWLMSDAVIRDLMI